MFYALKAAYGLAKKVLAFLVVINNACQLEIGELKLKISQFSDLARAIKKDGVYLFFFHFLIFIEEKLFDVCVEIHRILEKLGGEFALSGKTFGCEKILQPVPGHGLDLEVAFVDQPLQKRIDQPQRNIETLGKLALAG
jgi:hypothetical protein